MGLLKDLLKVPLAPFKAIGALGEGLGEVFGLSEGTPRNKKALKSSSLESAVNKLTREKNNALLRINAGRLRSARRRIRGGIFGAPEATGETLGG